jgi:hypothetical protein
MDKQDKKPVSIAELEVEPITDEEIAAALAAGPIFVSECSQGSDVCISCEGS